MATIPGAPIVQPRPLTLSQQLEFFWSPPSSDGGSAITSYVITDGTTSNTLVADARWYRATGLANGTVYQYRVAASNSIGLGPYSFFRAVQPGLTPGTPTNVSYSNLGDRRYQISWNNPSDTGQASLQRAYLQAFPLDANENPLSTSIYSSFIIARTTNGGNPNDANSRILQLFSNYNYKVLVRVMNDPGFSLPITYTSTIYTAPFSPDTIAALRLWLDATETSNFTLSTNFISTWTDKSANAYKVSQTTQSNFPSFSTNFVTFSTFQYLNLPQAALNNVSTWTMMFYFVPRDTYAFVTAKQHDANNTYNVISYATTINTSGAVTSGLSTTMYLDFSNAGSTINYPVTFPTNSINLVKMQYDAQSNLTLWNNGFLWSTIRGDYRMADVTNATNATLGALIQSNAFRNPSTSAFSLGSLLFYSTILAASNSYKLEGYLANLYNQQSNLPVNHPYFATPPTTTDTQLNFSPSSISSLQLWLDANDATTLTFSTTASTVTQWRDKSGQSRHAIPFQGQPFYSNTALTGNLPGIVFSNASTLYAPAPPNTFASSIHAFVVFQKTGAAVATNETVVARTLSNQPAPFDVYDTTRLFGNGSGVGGGSFSSALNIKAATSVNNWSYRVASNIAQEFWQGSTVNQSIGVANMYGDTASNIWFGTRADSYTAYRGVISESLFYSSTLTFGERQAVEGYLAWKWGTQSSLIIDHPFRFQPPTTRSLYEGCNGSFSFVPNYNSTLVVPTDTDLRFGTGDFTCEWWQWIDSSVTGNIWGYGVLNAGELWTQANPTGKAVNVIINASLIATFSLPNTIPSLSNSWHHVALVRSTGTLRCFYDGMSSPTSVGFTSNLSSTVYNLHIGHSNYRGYIGDFHMTKGRALYWANNFSPASSLQSNVSTVLLLKPTTRGRAQLDKGPLQKQVFNFAPVDWTPNLYPNFVQSFGTLYNPSGTNYATVAIDNDLRFRTSDFTIEFYFHATADNNRPWGLGYYNNGDVYMDCEFLSGASVWAIRFDSFPPNFNNGYTLPRNAIGSWNHYAFTRQGTTCRAFQNGILLGSNTSAYDFNPTSSAWNVGAQPTYTGAYGYMTNFHLVKGVALYTSSFVPPSIPIQSNVSTQLLLRFASSLTVNADAGPRNKTVTTSGTPSWYYATRTT